MPCTVLMGLFLTSQSILECNFYTHTDLLGHITVVHCQATYNVLIGRLTLTAALSGTKGENVAFRLKSVPTHGLRLHQTTCGSGRDTDDSGWILSLLIPKRIWGHRWHYGRRHCSIIQ